MALTREFKDTVLRRAQEDPAFREGLLTEALDCLLAGELDAGKLLLRDYVNATIGFRELARRMDKKDTSIKRMLGPSGNPSAQNLFTMTRLLQQQEGVRLKVIGERRDRSTASAA